MSEIDWGRCDYCGWPLKDDTQDGCTLFADGTCNCSTRPRPEADPMRLEARRLRAALAVTEQSRAASESMGLQAMDDATGLRKALAKAERVRDEARETNVDYRMRLTQVLSERDSARDDCAAARRERDAATKRAEEAEALLQEARDNWAEITTELRKGHDLQYASVADFEMLFTMKRADALLDARGRNRWA